MNKRITAFGAVLLFAFVLLPSVSAAVAATPGSTTTLMGMPVSQRITGLSADTTYYLDCETATSTEADQTLISDSSGVIECVCYPAVYGSNLYNLTLTNAAGASQITWNVNNMDIIPYLIPIIVIAIVFGVMKSFKKMV